MPYNAIEGGRWDNLLRRFFNIKERGVAPSMASEIVPVFAVEPPDDPTDDFLRDNRLMAAAEDVAAVAAEFGIWELRNPANSGMLVVVSQMWASARGDAIANFVLGIGVQLSSGEINAVTKGLRDLRWDAAGALIQQSAADFLSYTDPAIPGVEIKRWSGPAAAGHFEWNVPIIIPPLYSVFGYNRTANERFEGGVVWSERPFEPSEL